MAETGKMACWMGFGKGFEIREYPVPDPEPGAVVIKVSIANVCGSDMHYWKGEQDYAKMGRPLPLNTGHEHMGTVHKLWAPASRRTQPASRSQEGDRVVYRYFNPCGQLQDVPEAQLHVLPHAAGQLSGLLRGLAALPGRLRPVLLPAARTTPSSSSRTRSRTRWRPGINCALDPGVRRAGHRRDEGWRQRGDPGGRRPRRLRLRGGARDGRRQGHRDRRGGRAAGAGQRVRRRRVRGSAPVQDAGRARRPRQGADRRLGRRDRHGAGRAPGRGGRGSADDGARRARTSRSATSTSAGRRRSTRPGSSSATGGFRVWPTTRPST